MLMTLNRDHTIVLKSGLSFRFEKDKPMDIPKRGVNEVLAIGGLIVETSDAVSVDAANQYARDQADARPKAIKDTIHKMMKRNMSGDFTAGGKPNLNTLTKLAGIGTISADELDPVWAEVKAEIQ